jgi:hypothetical protein
MEQDNQKFQQSQQGSGSAEQTSGTMEAQQHPMTDLSGQEKKEIGKEAGTTTPVTSIKDMGGMSGRDDAAGGSGDNMENESSGESTDR